MSANVKAERIMLGALPEQRRQSRVQLPLSARVIDLNGKAEPHTAHLRDLNILGAFFYSDLQVAVGDAVRVALTPSIPDLNVNCEARVVRVEQSALNGLTGVAVQFHDFVVQEPEGSADEVLKPTAKWTASMVDKKFARRPELQSCAERIQGAA
jgi:hypothetical protein